MNLASCVVATIFLLFVVILISILYFTLFKPRDPKLSVAAVQLPAYSAFNDVVNFTFAQYVAVRNPNRVAFAHYDSSLQLLYAGNQVGFMFIPAGEISAGRTEYLAATFSVQSFPLVTPAMAAAPGGAVFTSPGLGFGLGGGGGGSRLGPAMQLESTMQMVGRVRVLHFFTHHLEAKSTCTVAVSVNEGTVLGFHC